jgi:hypothetical protein
MLDRRQSCVVKWLPAAFAAAAAITVLMLQPSLSAVPFLDIDSFIGKTGTGRLVTQSSPVNGSFDITSPGDGDSITIKSGYTDSGLTVSDITGFRPGIDTVTSGVAYFYVRDDNDSAADRVNVKLDNISFVDNYKITTPVFVGNFLAANILVQLNTDGKLEYSITPQGNTDFYIEYASLLVDATLGSVPSPTAVPEGGSTLLFMGCGLIALAGVKKKLATQR